MSRNKYPEETYQLIIDVSMKLFMTKGYEKTSLQDIINNLGGLTKGAIYHHFKSKEEILIAVVNYICCENSSQMASIRDDLHLNGKEKLEKMFSVSLENPKQKELFSITPNLLDNSTFLAYYIKSVYNETVPDYIVPVVREGVKDGSIKTNYPDELADLIMQLSDIWLNPLVYRMSDEALVRKALLLNQILKIFNISIMDEKLINNLSKFRNISDDGTTRN